MGPRMSGRVVSWRVWAGGRRSLGNESDGWDDGARPGRTWPDTGTPVDCWARAGIQSVVGSQVRLTRRRRAPRRRRGAGQGPCRTAARRSGAPAGGVVWALRQLTMHAHHGIVSRDSRLAGSEPALGLSDLVAVLTATLSGCVRAGDGVSVGSPGKASPDRAVQGTCHDYDAQSSRGATVAVTEPCRSAMRPAASPSRWPSTTIPL